jgi:glycosyltransferase 2 family protein
MRSSPECVYSGCIRKFPPGSAVSILSPPRWMPGSGGFIRNKKTGMAVLLLLAVAAICVIGYRWYQAGFDPQAFLDSFADLDWRWVAAATALVLATYYGRVIRWAVMIRPLKPNPSYWNLFVATAIGFTAIVLIGRPGEIVRPYLIAKKEEVPFSSQVAAWLLERIYDLLVVLLLSGFALVQAPQIEAQLGPNLRWVLQTGGQVIGVIAAVSLGVLILLRQYSEAMRKRLLESLTFLPEHQYKRAEQFVDAFVQGVQSTRSGTATFLIVLYTFIEWLLIAACFYCLFKAQPVTANLNILDVLMFVGFVSFGSIVQIPGVGGGMQVVSVLVLTELFGVALEPATGLALLIWVITFVVIVPFGLVLAFHEGLTFRKLKQMEKDIAA